LLLLSIMIDYYVIYNSLILFLIIVIIHFNNIIKAKNKEIKELKLFKDLNQTFIYNKEYNELIELLNNNDEEIKELNKILNKNDKDIIDLKELLK